MVDMSKCKMCGSRTHDQEHHNTIYAPLQEYYEKGVVVVLSGYVLLRKPDKNGHHAKDIRGSYCNGYCLKNMIEILRRD